MVIRLREVTISRSIVIVKGVSNSLRDTMSERVSPKFLRGVVMSVHEHERHTGSEGRFHGWCWVGRPAITLGSP
jgi:hypothetical protein